MAEGSVSRETAAVARSYEADGKSDLTAGRAAQELTQPHQIGISLLVEPASAHDELFASSKRGCQGLSQEKA